MHTTAAIKSATYYAARRMISENMEAAILKATGAVVEVTMRQAGKWSVSGKPESVEAALPVMQLAGLKVEGVEYDEELGESFAYLTE